MKLWVVGSGGLFGSAITRAAHRRGWVLFRSSSVPWSEPEKTFVVIAEDAARFETELAVSEPWGIVWAAGRATTTSSDDTASTEFSVFTRSIQRLNELFAVRPGGSFLLASSAGGVYAGCEHPPFDSSTTPSPVGVYGRLKLEQEKAAQALLTNAKALVIARIANLYGPGQDLSKLQGLISRLAYASVTKEPLTMFVSLDTLRDYVHVDDAAEATLHWLSCASEAVEIRIVASGRPVTLGYVIGQMKNITKTRIPIAYGMHASAAAQAHDLRLLPDRDPIFDKEHPQTPLSAGMKGVYQDLLRRIQ